MVEGGLRCEMKALRALLGAVAVMAGMVLVYLLTLSCELSNPASQAPVG